MNKIIKNIVIIIGFVLSATVVYAGFNYNSAMNYFFVDSALKIGGNYVLVGDALDEEAIILAAGDDQYFAVSGNIIFKGTDSQFLGGDKNLEAGEFSTSKIEVRYHDFEIYNKDGSLVIEAPEIVFNKALVINQGDNIVAGNELGLSVNNNYPLPNTVQVNDLYVNEIYTLAIAGGSKIQVNDNTVFEIDSGKTVSADSIIYGGSEFCQRKNYNVSAHKPGGDNNNDDGYGIGMVDSETIPRDGGVDYNYCGNKTDGTVQISCCDPGYYIFDIDVEEGKMICCRYR